MEAICCHTTWNVYVRTLGLWWVELQRLETIDRYNKEFFWTKGGGGWVGKKWLFRGHDAAFPLAPNSPTPHHTAWPGTTSRCFSESTDMGRDQLNCANCTSTQNDPPTTCGAPHAACSKSREGQMNEIRGCRVLCMLWFLYLHCTKQPGKKRVKVRFSLITITLCLFAFNLLECGGIPK